MLSGSGNTNYLIRMLVDSEAHIVDWYGAGKVLGETVGRPVSWFLSLVLRILF